MADKFCELLCDGCEILHLPEDEQRQRAIGLVHKFAQQWYYGDIVDRRASALSPNDEPVLRSFNDVGTETGLFEDEGSIEESARHSCAAAHAREECFAILDIDVRLIQ